MRAHQAGLPLLAAAVLVAPLSGWHGIAGVHLLLFVAGASLLHREPGFRRAFLTSLAVLGGLSLLGQGGIAATGTSAGQRVWRVGVVRLPMEAEAVTYLLLALGFLATVLAAAVFLLLLPAVRARLRGLVRPVAILAAVGVVLHAGGPIVAGLGGPDPSAFGMFLLWVQHLAAAQAVLFLALRLREAGPGEPIEGEPVGRAIDT